MASIPPPDDTQPRTVRSSTDQRLHSHVQYNPNGASGRLSACPRRLWLEKAHGDRARLAASAAARSADARGAWHILPIHVARATCAPDILHGRAGSGAGAACKPSRLTPRALCAADVRLFDGVRLFDAAQRQKLLELAQMLDIWNLRSFRGQGRRERAWNAATRVLPCLTWMVKYNPRKQLAKDIAAGIAVSFLIVPQARSGAARGLGCGSRALTAYAARRGCRTLAWQGCPPFTASVRARCAAGRSRGARL